MKIDNWKIAQRLYPTADEEFESSSLLPVTYAAQVIEFLSEISGESEKAIEAMCGEYQHIIDRAFEYEDEAEVVAREIWDLWLND